jgi:Holliday junction resolvasome RuvABC DNA-binding subunit
MDVLSTLIHLGYPRAKARKAVRKAVKKIPNWSTHDFGKLFRASMKALR